MEQTVQTQQALEKLRSQAEGSPILPIVIPLFFTPNQQPKRASERNGDAQVFWEVGEEPNNFERLCLTLSRRTLSLTVALEHQHLHNQPALRLGTNEHETAARTSMVINSQTHALYQSNRGNGVLMEPRYDQQAIGRFMPELTHTLATIGLYSSAQRAH